MSRRIRYVCCGLGAVILLGIAFWQPIARAEHMDIFAEVKGGSEDSSQVEFIDAVQRVLGSRYGGMWIEGATYNIGVVLPTEADRGLANFAPVGATVRLMAATYSYEQLTTFAQKASQVMQESNIPFVSIGPAADQGKVEIDVAAGVPVESVSSALAAVIPADSFSFVTSGGSWIAGAIIPLGYEAREHYPPYRGGRTLYFPDNQLRCSAGIAFVSELSGLIQGSTAGHCAQDGWVVKSGGEPDWPASVGVTNLNVFLASNPAFGDAQLIGPTDQDDMTRKIFEDTYTYNRIVVAKYQNPELVKGLNVCKTGVGGGTKCGTVVAGYPQLIFEQNPPVGTERFVNNLVFISVTDGCYNGDSGGAVYHRMPDSQARAAGDISAILLDQDGNRTSRCAFDPVGNIGSNTSSHVWLNPLP